MKAQSADKMKAVITSIVEKVCPGFAWADGEVLVVENWPYRDLYIECLEDTVSVGFYTRVYGESWPNPIHIFNLSDWTLRGYKSEEVERHEWRHKDLTKGHFNETIYNKIIDWSDEFAIEINSLSYARGKVKKHHHL